MPLKQQKAASSKKKKEGWETIENSAREKCRIWRNQ